MILPLSQKTERVRTKPKLGKDSAVPLQAWVATKNANIKVPEDPPGYVYPW
jgi:hypothetical protein